MLALIAGDGALPAMLHARLTAKGEQPLVAELEGFPSNIPGAEPIQFRVEQLATFLNDLKARGVSELCLAGKVQRPKLDPNAVDEATEPFVPGIVHAIQSGDDAALREILAIIEEFGFVLRAAHEVLPELLATSGVHSARQPDANHTADADRASQIIETIGKADIGQSCVVCAGQALAVETLGGTDWMLRSISGRNRPQGPAGGILFKAPKPGQDRRADLPVIGPDTIESASKAGLDGIVIETGGVMVLDLEATVERVDKLGMFLWVRDAR